MIVLAAVILWALAVLAAPCVAIVYLANIAIDTRRIADALERQEATDNVIPIRPPRKPAA